MMKCVLYLRSELRVSECGIVNMRESALSEEKWKPQ
jgi:hypothetical protein